MPSLSKAADLGVTLPNIPYNREYTPRYGEIVEIAPGLRRLLAPNGNAFTFHGTGTYIVGHGNVAVIDPGPLVDSHVRALLDGLKGEQITHLLITHTHGDHSPAAAPVRQATGASTYGFGPHAAGKKITGVAMEEGGDTAFKPDVVVRDGDVITGDGFSFECVFTPGHTSNHVCYAWREGRALFSGDHVMGWSTTVIVPPDGDMAEYFASLRKLIARDDAVYYPTHGGPITAPQAFVSALHTHRAARETQIEACLQHGITTLAEMVRIIYSEVDPKLHPAASMSVRAHLTHLRQTGRLSVDVI